MLSLFKNNAENSDANYYDCDNNDSDSDGDDDDDKFQEKLASSAA